MSPTPTIHLPNLTLLPQPSRSAYSSVPWSVLTSSWEMAHFRPCVMAHCCLAWLCPPPLLPDCCLGSSRALPFLSNPISLSFSSSSDYCMTQFMCPGTQILTVASKVNTSKSTLLSVNFPRATLFGKGLPQIETAFVKQSLTERLQKTRHAQHCSCTISFKPPPLHTNARKCPLHLSSFNPHG